MNIIKKVVGDNRKRWDSKIEYAMWANRITTKRATGKSAFELVYRMDVKLPINLKIPVYECLQQSYH